MQPYDAKRGEGCKICYLDRNLGGVVPYGIVSVISKWFWFKAIKENCLLYLKTPNGCFLFFPNDFASESLTKLEQIRYAVG